MKLDTILNTYIKKLSMNILCECNYKCWYCLDTSCGIKKRGASNIFKNNENRNRFLWFLDKFGPWYVTLCGTGEIILLDGLFHLCHEILQRGHYLALITNLSTDTAYEFASLPKDKILKIQASLHPEADEKKFFHKVEKFKKKSLPIIVSYVATPDRISNLQSVANNCKQLDVPFHVQGFYGSYRNRRYPESYSAVEKKEILKYMWDIVWFKHIAFPDLITQTRNCNSGFSRVSVYQDIDEYHIFKCRPTQRIVGNWYEGWLNTSDSLIPCENKSGCIVGLDAEEELQQALHIKDFHSWVPPLTFEKVQTIITKDSND